MATLTIRDRLYPPYLTKLQLPKQPVNKNTNQTKKKKNKQPDYFCPAEFAFLNPESSDAQSKEKAERKHQVKYKLHISLFSVDTHVSTHEMIITTGKSNTALQGPLSSLNTPTGNLLNEVNFDT